MYFGQTKQRILKLIDEKPSHGYDIAKQLDRSLTTVYEHLKYLENKGLITKERSEANGKKICIITEKGKEFLSFFDDY